MTDHPLRPATRLCLGRPLPYQLADGPQAHPLASAFVKWPTLTSVSLESVVLCCISLPFGKLSTTWGKVTYVLLTRAPLYRGRNPFSLDLHVLSAPLTFVLSQDQTLQLNPAVKRWTLSAQSENRRSNSLIVLAYASFVLPSFSLFTIEIVHRFCSAQTLFYNRLKHPSFKSRLLSYDSVYIKLSLDVFHVYNPVFKDPVGLTRYPWTPFQNQGKW